MAFYILMESMVGLHVLNRILNVQECDATPDDSSNAA